MPPRRGLPRGGRGTSGFRSHGVATSLEISGQNIPVRVRRPTLDVTRERGTNVQLVEEEGGTSRLIVDARRRRRREAQGGNAAPREEGWKELPGNMPNYKDAAGWANVKAEEMKKYAQYWENIDWKEKWDDRNYVAFEAERARRQRNELKEKMLEERQDALKKLGTDLQDELKKPWWQRKRNKGNIMVRMFGFGLDVIAVPFFVASWTAGRLGRPLSWINDKLLGAPQYGSEPGRTQFQKGTTRRHFMETIFAERRDAKAAIRTTRSEIERLRTELKK